MKKSKMMKALLVFGMSMVTATAVIGFTACGDDHDHVDADNDGKCDICDADITTGGEQGDNSGTVKVDVENIELNASEITLEIGGEFTLTATVTPDNADNKTVTWASLDPTIATVADGKVTAVAAGTTTITATADGKTANCNVTVNAPAPKPEVTADEWEAALSETAFTNFTSLTKMSNAEEGEAGVTFKVDLPNGKYYNNENGDTYYSKESDDEYYKYIKNEGSEDYSKVEITEDEYNDGLLTESSAICVTAFKDSFADVEYKSETGSYTGTDINVDGLEDINFNIEFKFDNGKLVYAEVDFGEDVNFIFEYSNYGTTTITLPTIGGETPGPGGETPDPEIPNITEWTEVGDPIYGEVSDGSGDHIWHHLWLQDTDKKYDFDSYTATVKIDGEAGTVVEGLFDAPSNENENNYHLKIHVLANRYQTAEFKIEFKKDGKVVATGTYTRIGDNEIVLDDDTFNISKDATEPTTVSVLKINGKTDLSGYTISWSISDNTIATIEDNGNGTVSVTAVAEGTATLTCTVGTGANAFSATCTINVVAGEVVEEKPVDVSTQLHEQEVYGEWNINIRLDCDADLGKNIASVEVTATVDGEAINVTVYEIYGTNPKYVKMGVTQDWTHDYVFTLNYKNKVGKVIATGTFTKEAQKSLTLSKSALNLTLKDGETVTETLTATVTGKVEGNLEWSINDTSVATVTDNGNGTATVTAVAKGTAIITVTIGNLTKTCAITVTEEGEEPPAPSLPDKQLTFNAPLKDYYGGTGNANYHDFISLADIIDNFEYSLDNIQVSATLNGQEIAVMLLPNGSLGGDQNMHFHVKIGDGSTTLDEIKSGLSITMIFIGKDGQPCAYALIEN